jgi:hypothetical protein
MRQYTTNYYLWAVATAIVFVPVARVLLAERSHGRDLRGFEKDLVLLGMVSAAVGWAVQGVGVVCGVATPKCKEPDQAADYDDGPRP